LVVARVEEDRERGAEVVLTSTSFTSRMEELLFGLL
jgi:hypothetical protein